MADFKTSFTHVLGNEESHRGSAGKITEDRGGKTRFGIASRFHPELLKTDFYDVEKCCDADALVVVEKIYHDGYWSFLKGDDIVAQEIADKLLDMAINVGDASCAQLLQSGLNQMPGMHIDEDRKIGPKTIARVNEVDAIALHRMLRVMSVSYYEHVASTQPVNENEFASWMRRAAQ